jgi:hypothetical protein
MHTDQAVWPSAPEITGDLTGFAIEALDGSIGTVAEYRDGSSGAYLVVDTGPWIFGQKVMLPAGVIDWVDYDGQVVFVSLTKKEIRTHRSDTL